MNFSAPSSQQAWQLFTRLGEMQILLPALLLAALALWRQRAGRPLAAWWLGALAGAALLTTMTKVAFIGWGIGSAALDFTGVSGHAMFAAAVYPLLLGALAPPRWRWPALALGALLAVGVGASRVVVDAHSVSEAVAGVVLGGAVSALALARAGLWRVGLSVWVPAVMAAWLLVTPTLAPPSNSHELVTRLALALAGHEQPHLRGQWRHRAALPPATLARR
jgi:membrane-associated phospholipid phosphatase